nr:putative kinase mug58 [Quercus suber]
MRRWLRYNSNMPNILDDKSSHCIPFILDRIADHRRAYAAKGEAPPPFFIGLNGVQGAGKTTLVTSVFKTLSSPPHSLPIVVLSIDDLYLPYSRQAALAKAQASNPLVQHRGQPSTHDVSLGGSVFQALANRDSDVRIPSYDKSAFSGQGDQRPEAEWQVVNRKDSATVDIVVFEGWCVGFRALADGELERKWQAARQEKMAKKGDYRGQLGSLKIENVNDADDTGVVYKWRQEQEAALRAEKGTGMTVEQVTDFVNGCKLSLAPALDPVPMTLTYCRLSSLRALHGCPSQRDLPERGREADTTDRGSGAAGQGGYPYVVGAFLCSLIHLAEASVDSVELQCKTRGDQVGY